MNRTSLSIERRLRGSTLAAILLIAGSLALGLLLLDAERLAWRVSPSDSATRMPVGDPALFNEARYARHASQADHHAAFQDHPMALEHFPAGSLMPPPRP